MGPKTISQWYNINSWVVWSRLAKFEEFLSSMSGDRISLESCIGRPIRGIRNRRDIGIYQWWFRISYLDASERRQKLYAHWETCVALRKLRDEFPF